MTDQVVETHCSTVVLAGDLAYKRKKPVDLGFLDFRTPAARWTACHAEVELNRRFSPDAYLGIATLNGPTTPWGEPLVVMRRMPDARRLSHLLASDEDVSEPLAALAARLAEVHRTSPAPSRLRGLGTAPSLLARWQDLAAALQPLADVVPDAMREGALSAAEQYLCGRDVLLAERVSDGRVVDGHGDLLADDVYLLADGPQPLDCLEFDEHLRIGDGLLDAAFLAMDLEHLGRPDLARLFLDAYRGAAHDDAPASLEHHYLAYRAQVRAVVAAVRASQTGSAEDVERARSLAALSLRHLDAGRVQVVVVGGLPGTGKSTVAAQLAQALGGCLLSSDVTRKHVHGLAPTASDHEPLGAGLYSPAATERTYEALLQQAYQSLVRGTSVVLDATFGDAGHRQAARELARSTGSALVQLHCVVDDDTARTRLETRPRLVSDATPRVRAWLAARAVAWPEATQLDTEGDVAATVRRALEAIGHGTERPARRG